MGRVFGMPPREPRGRESEAGMRKALFVFLGSLVAMLGQVCRADEVTYSKQPCPMVLEDGVIVQNEVIFKGLPSPEEFRKAWEDPSNCEVTIDLGEQRIGPNDPLFFVYDDIVAPDERKDSGGCGSKEKNACGRKCESDAEASGKKLTSSDCIGWVVLYGKTTGWICKCSYAPSPPPQV